MRTRESWQLLRNTRMWLDYESEKALQQLDKATTAEELLKAQEHLEHLRGRRASLMREYTKLFNMLVEAWVILKHQYKECMEDMRDSKSTAELDTTVARMQLVVLRTYKLMGEVDAIRQMGR